MIQLLKKSGVALFVLALALIAQIPHAAHVFDRAPYIGHEAANDATIHAWLLAYAYAIALESATLMFVVHGHKNASYGFALASFAVNLSYYAMHSVDLWTVDAFPAWLLSALLPIAIASYSHILTAADDVQVQVPGWALRVLSKLRNAKPVAVVPVAPATIPKAKSKTVAQLVEPGATIETVDIDAPQVVDMQPVQDTQPVAIEPAFQAQLDEVDTKIIDAMREGAYTAYAISKKTGITLTTLKRTDKATGKVSGRLPKLVAANLIHNSSGADGSEYRING